VAKVTMKWTSIESVTHETQICAKIKAKTVNIYLLRTHECTIFYTCIRPVMVGRHTTRPFRFFVHFVMVTDI
jgi:hypothetical protein